MRGLVANESVVIAIEATCAGLAREDDLQGVVARTLAAEGMTEPVAITVVLVDDATIHRLNRQFLQHDEPTDVITFPLDNASGAGERFVKPRMGERRELGEIYISCERAAAQSLEWGGNPEREVRFLVVHGVLHLLGWDDATDDDRARMLARQEEILAGWVPAGPGQR